MDRVDRSIAISRWRGPAWRYWLSANFGSVKAVILDFDLAAEHLIPSEGVLPSMLVVAWTPLVR